ncbi:twin transmembrane helix small protein [Caenimonas koreensis DSM 17982]|uniref:Twin transmembrane helix small protein n=2 Tax=Caenimonas TaxID=763439 RepID=A0A844B581_9BURK|nr:twin transmembrane helix small protein [Caenimonas koreensis DSM 17982]
MASMKYIVLLAFLAIVASLGSALFFMMRGGKGDKAKSNNMVRALTFRIGLSVLLFICILVAWKLGYIQPTGIPLSR